MDEYGLIIVLALIGFIVVAALVLYPVYKFLLRQEEISRDWTEEKLAERLSKRKSGSNGEETREEETEH
jgi:hypothetical protein